jgi:hypothetical protein
MKKVFVFLALILTFSSLTLTRPDRRPVRERGRAAEAYVTPEGETGITHVAFVMPDIPRLGDRPRINRIGKEEPSARFTRMLQKFYDKGYVLVDIGSAACLNSGGFVRGKIELPEGKRALILSFDGIYKIDENSKATRRLVLDGKGEVTAVINRYGKEEITPKGDIVPIVETFIKEHPDFSYKGARPIISVSANSLLGYDIGKSLTQEEMKTLKAVASKMKKSGWRFAYHGFEETEAFKDNSISPEALGKDLSAFKEKIVPIIGETPIFTPPSGRAFSSRDERFVFLKSEGFYIHCPISREGGDEYGEDYLIQTRVDMFRLFPPVKRMSE